MSRTAGVLFVTATCTFATIAIIIYGPWRGQHKWSTVWYAVQTPHARVEGVPSAPKPNCPSACRAGCIGWDVLCWLGHRRFARHWSVPQLRLELKDTHQIRISDDAIARDIGLYQTLLAARQQDPERLAEAYKDIEALVLTIDGLQPEKGHETF